MLWLSGAAMFISELKRHWTATLESHVQEFHVSCTLFSSFRFIQQKA